MAIAFEALLLHPPRPHAFWTSRTIVKTKTDPAPHQNPRTQSVVFQLLVPLIQLSLCIVSCERCLAAVLDATPAYHDLTSLTHALANISHLHFLPLAPHILLSVTSPIISRTYVQSRPPRSFRTVLDNMAGAEYFTKLDIQHGHA